jgi:hypothetical protein
VAVESDDLRRRARELIDETREIRDEFLAAVRKLRETVKQVRRNRGVEGPGDTEDDPN